MGRELSARPVDRSSGVVVIMVADDGVGGADASAGTGIAGLEDRVAALGGTFMVRSPAGDGTVITAELPCA